MTRLEMLEHAKCGILTDIGTHPAPREYPEDIEVLEDHLEQVERMIASERANIARRAALKGSRK
jgi:hypothetical protein